MIARVRVPSLTAAGQQYLVQASRVGDYYDCDCPRAGFTRPGGAPCKHVAIVGRANELMDRCRRIHSRADYQFGIICEQCLVELLALMAGKVRREFVTKAESKAKVAAARKKRKRKPKAVAASAEG